MKKVNVKRVLVTCLAAVLLVGSLTMSVQAASKGYQFKRNGVTISMHGAAKKFIKKAGKAQKTKVSKSCAYDGKDRVYQYKDYILYTYSKSDKGAEYVNGITFRTSKVSTKEGIKIGSTEDDVLDTYGKAKPSYGVYTYKKGKSMLQIEVEDGKVTNIRYVAS
jgi:hypothetical protein